MSERRPFRQSMAWLHAWSGLVIGWVLFAIFVTGTASYYRADITRWMRPELTEAAPDPVRAATLAGEHLARHAPGATGWYVELPKPEMPLVNTLWWQSFDGPFHRTLLDPETGAPTKARDTRGGDFLYQFHFELSLPPLVGRWVVGACAMVLLIALLSGIVTHRRIFVDFFTFRRRSDQRGWLDAHNVAGVLALPFHLMIVYTGLVTLAPMLMPWGVSAAYRQDVLAFFTEAGTMPPMRAPAGRSGPSLPLGEIVARAAAAGGEMPEGLSVLNPGDAAATVTAVFEEPHGGLAHVHPQISYDAATGAELARVGTVGPATRAGAVMVGLHEAHFAGPALRVVFFLCGVMGAATVASGLILWAVARTPRGAAPWGLGLRIVRVLNLGTIIGLPTALAAYFLANRVLPLSLADRGDWEVRAFFAAWSVTALVCALLPRKLAWQAGLSIGAATFAATVAVDIALVGQGRFLGFDLALLGLCAVLGLGARLAARPPHALRRTTMPAEALHA